MLYFQRGGGGEPSIKVEISTGETAKKVEANGVAAESKKVPITSSHTSKR